MAEWRRVEYPIQVAARAIEEAGRRRGWPSACSPANERSGRLISALALVAAAVAVTGCGGDDKGTGIPAVTATALDAQLDGVETRLAEGSAGACRDILDAPDSRGPNKKKVEELIDSMPDDVDSDVKSALEDSFDHLWDLVQQECDNKAGKQDTNTTPTDTTPTDTTPPTRPTTRRRPRPHRHHAHLAGLAPSRTTGTGTATGPAAGSVMAAGSERRRRRRMSTPTEVAGRYVLGAAWARAGCHRLPGE